MNLLCRSGSDCPNNCATVPGQLQLRWSFSHSNDCTLSKDNRRTTKTKKNFKQKVQNKRSKEKLKNVSKRKSHSKRNLIIIVFLAAERLCGPCQEWRHSPERNGKNPNLFRLFRTNENQSRSFIQTIGFGESTISCWSTSSPAWLPPDQQVVGSKRSCSLKHCSESFFSSTGQAAHLLQYLPHRWNG